MRVKGDSSTIDISLPPPPLHPPLFFLFFGICLLLLLIASYGLASVLRPINDLSCMKCPRLAVCARFIPLSPLTCLTAGELRSFRGRNISGDTISMRNASSCDHHFVANVPRCGIDTTYRPGRRGQCGVYCNCLSAPGGSVWCTVTVCLHQGAVWGVL